MTVVVASALLFCILAALALVYGMQVEPVEELYRDSCDDDGGVAATGWRRLQCALRKEISGQRT